MIIGLTGKNGAGKTEVVNILKKGGFITFSLSDVIRMEIQSRGEEVTRELLIETGRRLREEGGPSVLAEKILNVLDHDKNYAIDSIRNPAEVKALQKRKDFSLFEVEANQKTRFERCKIRGRENDPTDFDKFVELENQELKSDSPHAQQLLATAELANHKISNDGTLEDLESKIKSLTVELLRQQTRPDWDEYFMNIAKTVALRSNCIKRKVAAVIVKDKRIISTGYNGTPRGVRNCNDGGCPRCNSFASSGSGLGECLCSHAEENSIVQASYHGVCINNATIYTTFSPCLLCTKMILNSGIKEVVFNAQYPMGDLPLELLKEAGIVARKFEG